jgi:peptidoglycan/xylan/chitin deacetylase (PgdA/CDA1 family)
MTHRLLSRLPYAEQKQEICGEAELEARQYGKRPILFRPPGGDYNQDTQRAAAACGMKAVVIWIAKANGGSMQYQIGHSLRPGDIVLMHFRPEFRSDMQAFLDAQKVAGLHTELLEDWLPPQ